MSDRRQEIEKQLRRDHHAEPPTDLARKIKNEIPPEISPASRPSRGQFWLIAAALLLMVAGGWLAARLLLTGPVEGPVTSVADRSLPGSPEPNGDQRTRPKPDQVEMSEAEPEKVSSKRQDPDSDSAFVDSRQPEPASEEAIGEQFPEQASAPPSEAAGVLPLRQPKDVDESVSADSRPRRRSAEPEKKLEARTTALPSPGGEEEETFATQEATDLRTEETTTIRESGAGVQPRDGAGTLEYEEIHEMILDGELPDPEGVRVDTVVSHFDYGDRPPWRRGMVSVFMEGGAAPFSPTRWRTVRIGVRARESESPIASNARITLELDPDTVTLFRRIGDLSIQRVTEDSPVVIDIGRIPSDFSASWLLEVKLNPDVHLDQMIARTTLDYESDGRKGEIDRVLRVGHVARTWRTSSSSLQLAILAGVWAEILTGERSGAILDLTYLANQLRAGSEEARGLVRLIHRTEELRRDSDRQPHP